MAKIFFYSVMLLVSSVVMVTFYNKVIHPLLFKEELEDTLETATEDKIRGNINKKAQEILEDTDV